MISIIMGSESDFPVVEKIIGVLEDFELSYEFQIISAHRTPDALRKYIEKTETSGTKIFIGVAGKAAHLPGVIASYTTLPVIGVPVQTADLGGMDSLLSIVQMPSGVPVATVAINGGINAAVLAAQILAIHDESIKERLIEQKLDMAQKVSEQNDKILNLI